MGPGLHSRVLISMSQIKIDAINSIIVHRQRNPLAQNSHFGTSSHVTCAYNLQLSGHEEDIRRIQAPN